MDNRLYKGQLIKDYVIRDGELLLTLVSDSDQLNVVYTNLDLICNIIEIIVCLRTD